MDCVLIYSVILLFYIPYTRAAASGGFMEFQLPINLQVQLNFEKICYNGVFHSVVVFAFLLVFLDES